MSDQTDAVKDALAEQDGPIGLKKVAEAASLSQSATREALTSLIASGEVIKDGNKGYHLTPTAPPSEGTDGEGDTPASGGMLLHRRAGVGEHDETILAVVAEMEGAEVDGPGVTIKAVSEASNMRVRVLENVLWRLSPDGGKYPNPPLELVEGSRPKRFRLRPEVQETADA